MCGQVHCLHSLLPPATNYSVRHRPKGHPFDLPRYHCDLSRKSFKMLIMSSNSFLVRNVFIFLCVTIAFIFFVFFCECVCYVFSIKRQYLVDSNNRDMANEINVTPFRFLSPLYPFP